MIAGDLLGERARLTPDKVALILAGSRERFTYAELNERAIRCAALFRNLSIRQGERIGILAHNRIEFVDAFFAAGKAGVILVPLNTRLTAHELEYIIRDSGIRSLLYDGELADTVSKLRDKVEVEHWVALDPPIHASDISYSAALSQEAEFRPVRSEPEDIYCLLYTSGTTGKP